MTVTDELDPTGGGVDTTKIVTVVAGLTALVTVVLNWFRGRSEREEKAEAVMIERYKVMLADADKAADVAKAEHTRECDAAKAEHNAFKAETGRQIDDLRGKVADLVSQVHYLQLYLAQSGVKMPPKWDRRSDPFLSLDDAKESE